jgi:phosphoribosylformimino-5-aminoimidazole carboxamide ribotide isomerase
MPIEIVPSIDLRGGKVVRLKQGDYGQQVTYDVDPFATARSFAEAGARWKHVVDLDGAKEGRPVQTELIARVIREVGLSVQVGGGIRTRDDVERLIGAGARRVVIGTKALEDWPWFESLLNDPAMGRKLVLALDAKGGKVATRGWTVTSDVTAVSIAEKVRGSALGAILYTDVAKDGMLQGPNFDETAKLAESTDVPVIASGGVGNIEHVRRLAQLPVWGAIIGRSLYEGTLDLREAIDVARGKGGTDLKSQI